MGNRKSCFECFEVPDFIVSVKTGDTKGAGLHDTLYLQFIDETGRESQEIHLSGCCMTVFKKGRVDQFNITKVPDFGRIRKIKLRQHEAQSDVDWYIEKITIRQIFEDENDHESVFPIHRWLKNNKPLQIKEYDCTLPQFDDGVTQRKYEISNKQIVYGYQRTRGLLPQIRSIPREEIYSTFHKWDIKQRKVEFLLKYKVPNVQGPEKWNSLSELEDIFKEKGKLPRPSALDNWKSDHHFGFQRLCGCNPMTLYQCHEIPENFDVNADALEPFLEGKTLSEAIDSKKIYMVNHKILDGIMDNQNNRPVPSPLGLFYLTDSDDLLPIAIQLFQEKKEDNPVFFPSDPEYTWLAAKMWFNNADAAYHRACLHIMSHMVMEAITISVHRQLSPSHPIFRLLGPYIKLVPSINHYELLPLSNPGGWIDGAYNVGVQGGTELLRRCWKDWRMDVDGNFAANLKNRGVFDPNIITVYPYRDDCVLLHRPIEDYVRAIVVGHYGTSETLQNDWELQAWAGELVSEDGAEMKGVPGNGKFENVEDLVQVLTSIIFLSTAGHAAVNLPAYDEYAFIPNYPSLLRGAPPKTKDPLSEQDIVSALPLKHTTLDIIAINKLQSERDSSGLADFKSQYQYDPVASPARLRFHGSLREVAATITLRNRKRKIFYDYLNPGTAQAHLL